jgi:hypothetical protein
VPKVLIVECAAGADWVPKVLIVECAAGADWVPKVLSRSRGAEQVPGCWVPALTPLLIIVTRINNFL